MYPDQVQRIRLAQQRSAVFTDEIAYRRNQAAIHLARRFKFRQATPDEIATIEYWVLNGGRRPWGL